MGSAGLTISDVSGGEDAPCSHPFLPLGRSVWYLACFRGGESCSYTLLTTSWKDMATWVQFLGLRAGGGRVVWVGSKFWEGLVGSLETGLELRAWVDVPRSQGSPWGGGVGTVRLAAVVSSFSPDLWQWSLPLLFLAWTLQGLPSSCPPWLCAKSEAVQLPFRLSAHSWCLKKSESYGLV